MWSLANVHPTDWAETHPLRHLVQVDEKKRFIYYAQQEQPLDIQLSVANSVSSPMDEISVKWIHQNHQ